jgi:N6-adenosine-specific RNA methylase IME4
MKKYQIIYADPPYSYGEMKPRKSLHRGGNPMSHYGVMTINEICKLPVGDYAQSDSALFLWITNPKLPFGFQILSAWGFDYKTTLTWVKTTKTGNIDKGGLGFYFRGATEHILFGTRGHFIIPTYLRQPNVFLSPKTRHSEKPQCVVDLIEHCYPSCSKIELFARRRRMGWDCWGNEVGNVVRS